MAKLAGVPSETIRQARAYLARLDKFSARGDAQTDLFAAGTAKGDPRAENVLDQLAALELDALSPRDAQAALYALKKLLDQ